MASSRIVDRMVIGTAGLCAVIAAGTLVTFVLAIALRGVPALSVDFLLEETRAVGASGGVLYQILGTLLLIGTAALVATPLSLGLALTAGAYLPPGRRQRALELLLYLLGGLPSILLGLFGYIVFVHALGWGKSWLAGGLLLGLMIVPTVAVAVLERVRVLPSRTLEAAHALGLTQDQVVHSVVLPASLGGLVTGLLLGLARAAGETAPLLFTATVFAGATLPHGVKDSPVLALPYHVFVLAQDSLDPAVAPRVWSAALVLLGVVFLLSLLALPLRLLAHEEARHG